MILGNILGTSQISNEIKGLKHILTGELEEEISKGFVKQIKENIPEAISVFKGSFQELSREGLTGFQILTKASKSFISTLLRGISSLKIVAGVVVGGLAILTAAIYAYSKADENALTKSKEKLDKISDEYESVTSEVKNLEGSINSLNEQIDNLDPITDSGEIKKLKEERAELEQEVALLKQRQEYLDKEESKAAKDTLETTTSSKYSTNGFDEVTNNPLGTGDMAAEVGRQVGYFISNQGVGDQVTEYEELDLAMEKINDLESQRQELEEKKRNLKRKNADGTENENYDKEYKDLEDQISNLDTQINTVEGDALTLATSVQKSWSELDPDTDGELKDSIGGILARYFQLTGAVDAATSSFEALSKEQQKNILINKLTEAGLDEDLIQSIMSNISENDYSNLFNFELPSIEEFKDGVRSELKELEQGGSVNLALRPTIDTSELNAKGWNAGDGTATVFTSTYSNEDGTMAMNFTPIIADPITGKYIGCLTPEELDKYVEEVMSGTREDDLNLQIGAVYNGENAIEQAGKDAQRIHELHEVYFANENDAESYGYVYAKAWMKGYSQVIDETSSKTEIPSLEDLNKDLDDIQSAYDTVSSAIEEYNEKKYLSVDTFQSLMDLEPEYLQYLMDEEGNLRLNSDALYEYTSALIDNMAMKKMEAIADYVSKLSDEERQLYLTKQATDETSASLLDFAAATIQDKIAVGELTDEELAGLKSMMSSVASWAENAKEGLGKGGLGKGKETDFKALLDSYLNLYEKELDAGITSFDNFLNKSRAMIEQYYAEGKISAADYWGYVEDLYQKQLDGYDKVISAVTSVIDDEIEKLEKQKEAVEKNYQAKIDVIQKEIDKLQEANEERNRQYELEKAQYELERAMNQRTKKVYTEEHGFIYTTDNEAIRDAQNDLAEKENELKISKLESQIESLEKEMESATETIDKQIDKLNDYKDQWNDVADMYEEAQNRMYAANVLGADWESQILSMRTDTLNTFANNYIATQQAIVNAAWASANEQNKALASIGTGQIDGGGDISLVKNDNSFMYDSTTGKTTSTAKTNAQSSKTTVAAKKLNDKKIYSYKYGTGTDNAKPGVHEVAESGNEIIIDNHGNAFLAEGHQLHAFEGGEIVKDASETKELLKNNHNLIPIQNLFGNIDMSSLVPSMQHIMPSVNLPRHDFTPINRDSGMMINIGDIVLQGVQNVDSLADAIVRELPNKINQRINRKY